MRWNWISINAISQAERPKPPAADPHPPSAAEAAHILNEAFTRKYKDPDWGMFIWLKMRTGACRGEMCALTLDRLDLDAGILRIAPGRNPPRPTENAEPPSQ